MAYENLCMYCFEDTDGQTVCPHCGRDSRTAVPQVQLLPGTIIYGGRFLVGRALGQDANGVVYTALDVKLQRRLRIREYFPRDCASRLSDGTVVPAAGMEDQFDAGLRRVKASVQNAENPANRHFFFEENGTGYIVQRKSAAAAAAVPVNSRDDDDDDDDDIEESDGPNVKGIIGIAIAVIAIVAIVGFALINILGGALDSTSGIQDVTQEEAWQPLELPTPTPYVAATIGSMVNNPGDDWMNVPGQNNVNEQFENQQSQDRTPIPTAKPSPTPFTGLTADHTINANSPTEEIIALQQVLVQQGWLDATDITGMYDAATVQAVKDFQHFMNTNYDLTEQLVVDGIAGRKTLSCLLQFEYSMNPNKYTPQPTTAPTPIPTVVPTPTAEPVINENADRETIMKVQRMLISLNLLAPDGMDGVYGENTRKAVVAFQKRVNELFGETVLQPTGVVNKLTWDYLKLYSETYGSTTPAPEVTAAPTNVPEVTAVPEITAEPTQIPEATQAPAAPTNVPTAEPGEEAPEDGSLNENSDPESIMALQSMLAKFGFMSSSQVDGVFGNQTHAAIANFQKYINAVVGAGTLEVTGNADAATLDMLLEMENINRHQQVDANSTPEQIARLQTRLAELKWLNIGGPTGEYDDATRAAVRNFQEYINASPNAPFTLLVTGIADPLTLEYLALNNSNVVNPNPAGAVTAAPTAEPEITPEPTAVPTAEPEVTAEPEITPEPEDEPQENEGINSSSDPESITSLQNMLADLGFLGHEDADGIFGSGTSAAVANFQKFVNLFTGANTLKVTGEADADTLDWLLRIEDELPYGLIDSESDSDAVAMVQQQLIDLGWLAPGHVTGAYDETTREATKAFQTYVNGKNPPITVRVSGYADVTTQQYLKRSELANPNPVGSQPEVTAQPEITAEPTVAPEITPEPEDEPQENAGISASSDPESIASLQNMLAGYGFLGYEEADGVYGAGTSDAVANFQKFVNLFTGANTLQVTGQADPDTLDWLLRMEDELPYGLINHNSGSDAVTYVQQRLIALGWLAPSHVTGEYDQATMDATKAFQTYVNGKNPPIIVRVSGYADITTQQYLLLDSLANPNPVGDTENPNAESTPEAAVTVAPTQEIVITPEPTAEPTEEPTPEPTEEPTSEPTEEPTPEPTEEPTPEPTEEPTPEPTEEPTPEPTEEPTPEPTEEPTPEPTEEPTPEPTAEPQIDLTSPADMVTSLQQQLVLLGLMTEDQISGKLDYTTLEIVAQFQLDFNARMGKQVLPVIDLTVPEKAVVDYLTLCAIYGVNP